MQTEYYIFRNNKLLFKSGQNNILPLKQREWEEVSSSTLPKTIIESPTEKGSYTVELSAETELSSQYEWVSLRSLVDQEPGELFKRWGRASQLLHWYKTNRFCGSCGTKTATHPSDLARICPNCETSYYPAISPCIIVLVYRENELLLARSPRFPEKMFSTLAGFIEPGESAEDTIRREVREEVSIKVKNIRYFDSQSWPFPGQLMLGFFADYDSGDIEVDGVEICEANWYPYDKLPHIPGPGTIAGMLIRHYVSLLKI